MALPITRNCSAKIIGQIPVTGICNQKKKKFSNIENRVWGGIILQSSYLLSVIRCHQWWQEAGLKTSWSTGTMAASSCLPGAGTLGIVLSFFNMPQERHQANGFHCFSWKRNKFHDERKLTLKKGQWCEISFRIECSSFFFHFWSCFNTFSVADDRLGFNS